MSLNNISTAIVFSISNNWWGTTDIASIRATISSVNADQLLNIPLTSISTQINSSPIPYNIVLSEQYISPANSTGVQDVVNVSAQIAQAANWNLSIHDSNNQLVNTVSGTGALITYSWDGKNSGLQFVADGRYSISITTSGAVSRTTALGTVVVDNTSPIGLLDVSIQDAVYRTSPGIINGTILDANMQSYTLSVADGISPLEPDFRLLVVANNEVNNGVIKTWKFGDILSSELETKGVKTLKLVVSDNAGNSAIFSSSLTLDHMYFSNVSATTEINPAFGEMANINFTISDPANISVRIFSTRNEIIRVINSNNLPSGAHTIEWDGKLNSGAYLPDGAYRYEIYATDGVNDTLYRNTLPELPASTLILIDDKPIDAHQNIYFKYKIDTAVPVRFVVGSSQDIYLEKYYGTGTHYAIWDMRDNYGRLYAGSIGAPTARITPLNINTIIIRGLIPKISGTGVVPEIEVKSNPYKVTHSYNQSSAVEYQISHDSMVTIKLLPPCLAINGVAGECTSEFENSNAILLVDNELQYANSGGVPNIHRFEWRGYNFNDVTPDTNNILVDAEGVYTYMIRATSLSTGLSSTYRGTLSLYK